jgi:hypothetical protein
MGVLDRNLDYFGGKRTYQYTEIMGFFLLLRKLGISAFNCKD